MSTDPKKPIEELLEATSKARRAQFGADPKMPNPMRAQLHHEIERVARSGDDSRRSGHWFHVLWPRFAFTTVSALILVSIATLWWWHEHPGSSRPAKLAMQQATSEAPPPEKVFEQGAAAGAAPAAPTFADSSAALRSVEAAKDTNALRAFAETTIEPKPVPTTEDLTAAGTKGDQSSRADKSLVAKEAQSGAPATETASPAGTSLAHSGENFPQQYSQNALNGSFRSRLKQGANVLNEFQVEQSDHEIRLVDADGSIYSGTVEPLTQNDARSIYNQKRNNNAPSAPAGPNFDQKAQSGNTEYYFRASGYSASLKKSLEIEGNYIAPLAIAQKKVARMKTESEERDEQSSPRITGVAKIHGESPVQIDAVAVP
jgi:hypothetical protein